MQFDLENWTDESGFLIGRDQAELARSALEREIREVGVGDAVGLNFAEAAAMTVSFAEAFFVPLLGQWSTGYYEEHPLVVYNANEEVSETIDAVLRLRHLAVLSINESDALLLGGERGLRETVQATSALTEFSAADIAERLGITLQAANNRLKDLVRRGALFRVPEFAPSGGRQYRYRTPAPNVRVATGGAHSPPARPLPGARNGQRPPKKPAGV